MKVGKIFLMKMNMMMNMVIILNLEEEDIIQNSEDSYKDE